MKHSVLIATTLLTFGFTQAQDLFTSEIPSVILNNFNLKYPKARDVEWERKGTNYEVEFETNWNKDHEIWYSATGEIVKHKEDISKKELPEKIQNKINIDFKGYYINDVERVVAYNKTHYKMDVNALLKDNWEIVIDQNGEILSKNRN
ncbi:hypothetical protein FHR24_000632 [Wenyingzhuangia heitensis]|uniref:Putative beta-lactamase-inhibitor-like PepSY-like domain-containing protein n=1 Tax=Wenyingzhuangia heitensis TaxID=1487859 RepID=A0ABX0U7R2_9FLAO|nr:PepSY-like domain-containing protein [Wenyingzhuangia heitensis]NIJ44193.1 hypothetical protein [Wenyingzhuangia heitensis]